ncbi:Uncharacterised protein [Vibrio cholerae]|uniref:Uncharacterized protein n=1 Tax=Vibrio cholerae TaxID=666 RepID=A0A656ASP9_VIBCL|nr:Uncharacterised protein [Vibrio cholerae]
MSLGSCSAKNASMFATCCCQSPCSISDKLALATAQASGLPIKVGPCIKQPASPAQTVSATCWVVRVADSVMYPPVSALPTQRISG